jgi:hypothetical protein
MSFADPVIESAVIGLLLTILGFLIRFNNNVIRGAVALTTVVEAVAVHEKKIEAHGNKISELIGANNARKVSANHLEPLTY